MSFFSFLGRRSRPDDHIEETLSREREEIRRREVHSKDRREEKGEDMKKSNVIEEVQKADAAQNR